MRNDLGRICFVRFANHELDLWKMDGIGGTNTTFNVSMAADPDVINGSEYEDWGLINFGRPSYTH